MSDIIRRAAKGLVCSQVFMETFSEMFAVELERQLRAEAGGDRIYIAKTCGNTDKISRDTLIWEKFTGNNIAELATEFKLSPKQIRRICRKAPVKKIGTSVA